MQHTHVIVESAEHYEKRKQQDNRFSSGLILMFVAAVLIGGGIQVRQGVWLLLGVVIAVVTFWALNKAGLSKGMLITMGVIGIIMLFIVLSIAATIKAA